MPGNDHIVCYGGNMLLPYVTWHNSSGRHLLDCQSRCTDCVSQCVQNGGVGVDRPTNGQTDIHMYIGSNAYMNQDLKCQVSGGPSAFIGVYLVNESEFGNLTEVINSTTV